MIKKWLSVGKFLCFRLETGGLVISWFLLCVFITIELIIDYSLVRSLIDCKNSTRPLSDAGNDDHLEDQSDDRNVNDESCFEITSTIIYALIAVILFVLMIFCFLCRKGTKERNYKFIKPLMIWEGLSTVGSIISVAGNPITGIVLSILNAYMFVILYSLHSKFKDESEGEQAIDLPELKEKEIF